jgi:hypothetical protein
MDDESYYCHSPFIPYSLGLRVLAQSIHVFQAPFSTYINKKAIE